MKNAIFITVRTNSSRLPKKCLLEIAGRPAIIHLIDRVKRARLADGIVLCTTTNQEDLVLCDIASKEGIASFRGSEKDKLERWRGAADKYDVDFFVTADGDDLFCEPELIDLAFSQYLRTGADLIESPGLACGAFTYGIRTSALRKVCQIKDSEDTEMMWVYFTQTGLFCCEQLEEVPSMFKRPEIRMTLDYAEDLLFFKNIIEYFQALGNATYSLRDILAYINVHPEVVKINQHRQQEFLDNQKKKTKLVLKEGDKGV